MEPQCECCVGVCECVRAPRKGHCRHCTYQYHFNKACMINQTEPSCTFYTNGKPVHYDLAVRIVHLTPDKEDLGNEKAGTDWLTKLYTLYHVPCNFRKKFHFVERSKRSEITQRRLSPPGNVRKACVSSPRVRESDIRTLGQISALSVFCRH
ncbi:hypothetical protein HJG60_012135 [Phyllostomus discolor]|uniref:Uncharacterized protein n=1 Tax=Phyllostomus discolor TaxID=89673 RepID=A0A833ZLN5_9CHIR|nr:hypothetical protein HJG60_012135 [Phyllostomus discolor]